MRKRLAGLLALVAISAAPQPRPDREGWLADLETAKTAIARTSPNLEWQVARGLDLVAVEARARRRLGTAETTEEARDAVRRFLRPFADGHMELVPMAAIGPTASDRTSPPSCTSLGIEDRADDGAIATRLPGYRALAPADASVPAGLVTIGRRRVGVLRIAVFAPSLAHCRAALASRPPPPTCDEACRAMLSARIDNAFLAEIGERLRALHAARADALLVDFAANGGGNDTAVAVARMLGGADVPAPPIALARTPATARDLAGQIEELDRARDTTADVSGAAPYRARLVAELAQARMPCDLAPFWVGRAVACTNLVHGRFAGGATSFDLPARDRTRPWAALISATAPYRFAPARWPGPLLLLVDGNSASATELLVAMLQDAGRATVIGAPTFGAGCGFTRPPAPVPLPHLGLALNIPDCARLRRDGTNEIDGVKPDIAVPFREFDTPGQRVQRLMSAMRAALDARRR